MFYQFKRQLLYKSAEAVKTRRVDGHYTRLVFPGTNQNFTKEDKLLEFFDTYIKALHRGNLKELQDKLEPRFFRELSAFIAKAPPLGMRTDIRRFDRKPHAVIKGRILIEGVSINRFANDYRSQYDISQDNERVVFQSKRERDLELQRQNAKLRSSSDDSIDQLNGRVDLGGFISSKRARSGFIGQGTISTEKNWNVQRIG